MRGTAPSSKKSLTEKQKSVRKEAEDEILEIEKRLRCLYDDLAGYDIEISETKTMILKFQQRLANLHNFLEFGDPLSIIPFCED